MVHWREIAKRCLRMALLGVAALGLYRSSVEHAREGTAPRDEPRAPSQAEKNRESGTVHLAAASEGDVITLSWRRNRQGRGEAVLYRTTTDLGNGWVDPARFPVAVRRLRLQGTSGEIRDGAAPQGVPLYYQLKVDGEFSGVARIALRGGPLGALESPVLRVDKLACTLTVCDGSAPRKRYPIALGRNPCRRKLHQDAASTPEGVYRIASLQPQATYHRAYDLDYPNAVDRFRYDFHRSHGLLPLVDGGLPDIGGEIQIHGRGIHTHWTHGCIALRNEDMDELFACVAIRAGTVVLIWGSELSRADVEGMLAGVTLEMLGYDGTPEALAELQLREGLPVTGALDERTRRRLKHLRSDFWNAPKRSRAGHG